MAVFRLTVDRIRSGVMSFGTDPSVSTISWQLRRLYSGLKKGVRALFLSVTLLKLPGVTSLPTVASLVKLLLLPFWVSVLGWFSLLAGEAGHGRSSGGVVVVSRRCELVGTAAFAPRRRGLRWLCFGR